MAEDQYLIERMRNVLKTQKAFWDEKKMMGGICFMVDNKMCFGTYKGGIMVRIDPEEVEKLILHNGAEQMIHGGRSMKGYLMISPQGADSDNDLEFWISKCLEFNPKAVSSKRKK